MIQKLPPINISRTKELAHDVYRYAYNNDSRIVTKLLEFYKEGINNPSVAKIIAKKATTEGCKHYGEVMQEDISCLRGNPWELIKNFALRSVLAIVNIEKTKNTPLVKEYYDNFEKEFKENLYPKTHKIREKIINEERVTYGKVTPRKPLSLINRLKYTKLFLEKRFSESDN